MTPFHAIHERLQTLRAALLFCMATLIAGCAQTQPVTTDTATADAATVAAASEREPRSARSLPPALTPPSRAESAEGSSAEGPSRALLATRGGGREVAADTARGRLGEETMADSSLSPMPIPAGATLLAFDANVAVVEHEARPDERHEQMQFAWSVPVSEVEAPEGDSAWAEGRQRAPAAIDSLVARESLAAGDSLVVVWHRIHSVALDNARPQEQTRRGPGGERPWTLVVQRQTHQVILVEVGADATHVSVLEITEIVRWYAPCTDCQHAPSQEPWFTAI